MSYTVLMIEDAVKDIEVIYRYLKAAGKKKTAKMIIEALREACSSLSDFPERGHVPVDLTKIGQFEYRQIVVKKYRIIYQISSTNVFIFGIFHVSRNINDVLKQRILIL